LRLSFSWLAFLSSISNLLESKAHAEKDGEKIKSLSGYLTRGLEKAIAEGNGESIRKMPYRDEAVPLWDCVRGELG
jgi:retron-type reverse transcriptase